MFPGKLHLDDTGETEGRESQRPKARRSGSVSFSGSGQEPSVARGWGLGGAGNG